MYCEGLYREIGSKLERRISNHEDLGVDFIHILGSRGCGKTQWDIEFNVRACDIPDKNGNTVRVDSYASRFLSQDVEELWDDWTGKLEDLDVIVEDRNRKRSRKTWEFDNNNKIKFKHINSQMKDKTSNTGLATSKAEYIIINVEEAYEVPPRKMQDFMDAVRGSNKSKQLVINLCNPWDGRNKYIAWCLKMCPFDEYKARTQGYNWKYVVETDEEGFQTRHLIIWCNWRMIKQYLSKQHIARILRRYITDPSRAKTADLGCPGIIDNSVYANFLDQVKITNELTPHQNYRGGGDVGTGGSINAGKTVFLFGGCEDNGGIADVYREFSWSNAEREPIDSYSLASMIVDFYIDCRKEFMQKTGIDICGREQLEIRVDNSADVMKDILNSVANQKGVSELFYFTLCSKYAILDRVHCATYKMGKGELRINEQCNELIDEFHLLTWDDNDKLVKPKMVGSDHAKDAFDYMFERDMKGWVDNDEVYEQYKKEGNINRRKRIFI